jgi:hypothetical protein
MMTLGKRPLVLIAATIALVGGVSACSSSTSPPAPATSTSETSSSTPTEQTGDSTGANTGEASGIPADVISAYFKSSCTAPSTYDQATETCTDDQGEAQTVSQFTAALSLIPVRVSLPAFAYAIFPPDKLPACPAKADVDAYVNDEGTTVEPPTVSDECLASVMVLMTSMAGAAPTN